jgi:EAL domain-containing protein (putative c-di-GMP-specific phosphodiesterase class I)
MSKLSSLKSTEQMQHKDKELNYLTRSLLHHPSPYIIYELDGSIAWANMAAKYIFNLSDLEEVSIRNIDDAIKNNFGDLESIALYYDTPIEITLRKINFFMRTRVHMIPVSDDSGIMLIELLCSSREGLNALKETIECIENNRIKLAYQKQYDLNTKKITGVEALLRMQDGKGGYFANDKVIPLIEGEKLFSLIVLESLNQVKEFFKQKDAKGLLDVTLYLNVSAHTIMHEEFCKIFSKFVDENNIKPNEFGLEVTETAELEDMHKAGESLARLKEKGIKIALDDFGAGYASLKYIKDLPIDVVKLDRHFTSNISDSSTARLIQFVADVCSELDLEMIGEGIETEVEKEKMINLGCTIGQGFLMHKPSFLDDIEIEN